MNTTLNKSQFGQRFAIFTGTLSQGFSIDSVVMGDDKAKAATDKLKDDGISAEAVPIGWPSDLNEATKDARHMAGTTYLVMFTNISSGIEVYGPYKDDEAAQTHGEDNRADDSEYEVQEDPTLTTMAELLELKDD